MSAEVFRLAEGVAVLSVSVEACGRGHVTVAVEGELDLESGTFFSDTFLATLPRADAVLLDLDEVSFMDSSGLRAVLLCASECEQAGVRLTLTGGSPQVRRLFDITGVSKRLTFVRSPTGVSA